MIGIYKITNNITNMSYVGQSIHIERRFAEHCFPSKTSFISKSIQKYGKENFTFEVIEECQISELDIKEQYWIKTLNTLAPNGYNLAEDSLTTHTSYFFFDKEIIFNIINDIQQTELPFKEIAKKYNINISNVSRINKGETHRQENLSYPLRDTGWKKAEKKYCLDCKKEVFRSSLRCTECENKHKREISLKNMKISREELKNLIRTVPFTTIAQQFNVTDNAIKKWCDKYNLPRTKREIKTYSDKEWEKI